MVRIVCFALLAVFARSKGGATAKGTELPLDYGRSRQ